MKDPRNWPAIFYSPHQDDEAIAMGGAIYEHVSAGRPVFVVLLTSGSPSGRMRNVYRDILRQPTEEDLVQALIQARNREFLASLSHLGVLREHIIFQGLDANTKTSSPAFVDAIADTVLAFEGRFPGASHKLISGVLESVGREANAAHAACWHAAYKLREKISDLRFYRSYVFGRSKRYRSANFATSVLTAEQMKAKRNALREYMRWEPEAGRLAYGYNSVSTLINAALKDPHEYIDVLQETGSNSAQPIPSLHENERLRQRIYGFLTWLVHCS